MMKLARLEYKRMDGEDYYESIKIRIMTSLIARSLVGHDYDTLRIF